MASALLVTVSRSAASSSPGVSYWMGEQFERKRSGGTLRKYQFIIEVLRIVNNSNTFRIGYRFF